MKELVYFIFILLLFSACSKNSLNKSDQQNSLNESDSLNLQIVYENFDFDTEPFEDEKFLEAWELRSLYNEGMKLCTSVTDVIVRPSPWNVDVARAFFIPYDTIRSMSTCGLLVTMLKNLIFNLDDMSKTGAIPWDYYSNCLYCPGVTMFNHELPRHRMSVEFFWRSNFFPILTFRYLLFIKEREKEKLPENQLLLLLSGEVISTSSALPYLEMLFASDMCMSLTNEMEKNQIMAMALAYEEKAKNNNYWINETYNIMIAIMLWCNYNPFIEEVVPRLREFTYGYYLTDLDGNYETTTIYGSNADLILKHAKNFLNEQKL